MKVSIGPGAHDMTFQAIAGHEYELGYPSMWIGRKPYVKDLTWNKNLTDFSIDGKPANPGAVDKPPQARR